MQRPQRQAEQPHDRGSGSVRLDLRNSPRLHRPDGSALPLVPRDALLLAWLALHGPTPREQLAVWLWPAPAPAGARANLRQRVRQLQLSTEGALLATEGQTLALQPGVAHDLDDEAAQLMRLADDAQAPMPSLLHAITAEGAPDAMAWLDRERQRLQQAALETLRQRAQALEDAGQPAAALPCALRLVAEEPLNEVEHRRLMRLHYLGGDRSSALDAYQRLQRLLQRDLKTAPDPQTQALARLIEDAGGPTPPAKAKARPRDPASAGPAGTVLAPASQAAAAWAAMARPPRLLQRTQAWAELAAAWREGGHVVVQGAPGLGKSRLLDDFVRQVDTGPGAPPLCLGLRPGDSAMPFALLARWLEAAWSQAAPALLALPGWARAEFARWLPDLGPAAAGELAPHRLVQAFHLLSQRHDRVFIDDLQNADDDSLALLPVLLDGLRTGVLAARTGELPATVQRWAERSGSAARGGVRRVALEPWRPETVAALLESAGWPAPEAAQWGTLLQRHTGGQPLAVLETMRMVLQAHTGAGELPKPPAALPFPPRVLGLLQHQLQALGDKARHAIDTAALAGPLFSPELAAAVLEVSPAGLGTCWGQLQTAGLIDAEGQGHALGLEAARLALAAPWRRELHRRIAAAAQQRQAGPDLLAAHWAAGGDHARAAACHEAAAAGAAALSRSAPQSEHLAQAAVQWLAAGDAVRAFDARAQQAEACVRGARPEQGVALAHELLAQADPVRPRQRAQALRVLALGLSMQLQHGAARAAAEQACQAARAVDEPGWRCDTALLWAMAAASLGDRADAQAALAEAAAVQPAPEDWRHRLTCVAMAANVCTLIGQLDQALAHQREALALAQRPEAATERVAVLNNLAAMLLRMGRHDSEALGHAEAALALAGQVGLGDSAAGFGAQLHVGLLAQALGRYSRAIPALEQSLAQAERLQMGAAVPTVQNHLAWLWIQLGQPERALRLLQDDPALANSARVRRWTLRHELHVLCDRPAPADPAPDAGSDTHPTVAAHLLLAQLRQRPAAERVDALPGLLQGFEARQQPAWARKARVLAVERPAAWDNEAEARQLALALHDELLRGEPCAGHGPEALWIVGEALRVLGEPAHADRLRAHARRWLDETLAQVPPALRRGWREGIRVHRALLGTARPPG